MRLRLSLCAPLLCAIALSGCDLLGGRSTLCPAVAEPAIVVEVRNAATGAPEAEDATGVMVDGEYADTLVVAGYTEEQEPIRLAGGYERGGTYDVHVEKQGFETWRREDVRVEEGECGPETEELTARLTPTE